MYIQIKKKINSIILSIFLICRFLPGAGAVEIELAQQLTQYADTLPGLEQYAVRKFALALEFFPKALAENSGVNATDLIEKMYKAHSDGQKNAGFDIDSEFAGTVDVTTKNIYDLFATKMWGLKYGVGAATTIIKVDEIIMSKRAGGPKPRQGPADADDD